MVVQVRQGVSLGDREVRFDEGRFQLAPRGWVHQGDLQQVVALERPGVHPGLYGVQPGHGDTAALAVAAVVHLAGGRQHVTPGYGQVGGEAEHPAAAFGCLGGASGLWGKGQQPSAGFEDPFRSCCDVGSSVHRLPHGFI